MKYAVALLLVVLAGIFIIFFPTVRVPPLDADCTHWVAPSPRGNDRGAGSAEEPWATLDYAAEKIPLTGGTVCFQSGVYSGSARINRRYTGTAVFRALQPYSAVLRNNGVVLSVSGGTNIIIDGFDIRHIGPGATPLVVAIDGSSRGWSENVTLRNNLIHDSYNNDLLKIYSGTRKIFVENNIFYNQGEGEEHLDINSVEDVFIQDNIFFNSYESSGRVNNNQAKQFIVIKDSDGDADGLVGSRRVTVRRNVFFNWQGQDDETFIQMGLDGKPYHEAVEIRIENNLLVGNSEHAVGSAFGVRGARDVDFINNTVVGNLPAAAYALWVSITDQNPFNENIRLTNNIWSDPTGTMGAGPGGGASEFSRGNRYVTTNLALVQNLYWNGGQLIPPGDVVSPMVDDKLRVLANPLIAAPGDVPLPVWRGSSFPSGTTSIRQEFLRLVKAYGTLPAGSKAIDGADPQAAPADDILRMPRDTAPDFGAFEYQRP